LTSTDVNDEEAYADHDFSQFDESGISSSVSRTNTPKTTEPKKKSIGNILGMMGMKKSPKVLSGQDKRERCVCEQ
jgi:hypothetical protein